MADTNSLPPDLVQDANQSGSQTGSSYDLARERLIVALDVASADAAIVLADKLGDQCQWFKIGLELYIAAGPSIVEKLVSRGHSIFLDLKLHDIPNQVAGAVRSAAKLGARMLTVHAGGGPAMLKAAQEALAGIASPPQLLAVTVLTSMDQAELHATGHARTPEEQVIHLAKMGLEAGMCGFVCSPQEVATVRALTGPKGILVTPGIRPSGAELSDQRRVATPDRGSLKGRELCCGGAADYRRR